MGHSEIVSVVRVDYLSLWKKRNQLKMVTGINFSCFNFMEQFLSLGF